MGIIALLFGMLGGAGAILGIITAIEILPPLGAAFTWEFWFMLSGILFLASIACGVGHSGSLE